MRGSRTAKNQEIMKNQDFEVESDEIGILLVPGEAEQIY